MMFLLMSYSYLRPTLYVFSGLVFCHYRDDEIAIQAPSRPILLSVTGRVSLRQRHSNQSDQYKPCILMLTCAIITLSRGVSAEHI